MTPPDLISTIPFVSSVTHVRASLLASSLRGLRERGLYDRYVEALPPAHRDLPLRVVGLSWLEFAVAHEHYRACEALELPERDIRSLGASSGDYLSTTFLGKVTRSSGITPWTVLARTDRFMPRMWRGGGVRVYKRGPKDAEFLLEGFSTARMRYFRVGMEGIAIGVLRLVSRSVVVTPKASSRADQVRFHIAWV